MRDEQLLASGAEMIIIEIIISIFLNLVQGKEIESENDYRFNRWNLTDSHWTGKKKKLTCSVLSFVICLQHTIYDCDTEENERRFDDNVKWTKLSTKVRILEWD